MEEVFEDPVTLEVMTEAMVTSCGHSFSKKTITDWLQNPFHASTCPLCKTVLKLEEIKPNFALREAIEKYKQSSNNENKESIPSHGCHFRELFADHSLDATSILYESFKDDPWIVYFLPDNNRKTSLTWFLSLIVSYGVKHGRVWAAYDENNKVRGIAIWQTPYEKGVSMWNLIKVGALAAPFKFGFGATYRMIGCLDITEKQHQEVMKGESHWSLYTIGVIPEFQSKGIGTALIKPILQIADMEALPIYIDTSNQRSTKFFERNGFEIAKYQEKPSQGPPFWSMVRKPKPKVTK